MKLKKFSLFQATLVLQITFLALRFIGEIDWPWVYIFIPAIAFICLFSLSLIAILSIITLDSYLHNKDKK